MFANLQILIFICYSAPIVSLDLCLRARSCYTSLWKQERNVQSLLRKQIASFSFFLNLFGMTFSVVTRWHFCSVSFLSLQCFNSCWTRLVPVLVLCKLTCMAVCDVLVQSNLDVATSLRSKTVHLPIFCRLLVCFFFFFWSDSLAIWTCVSLKPPFLLYAFYFSLYYLIRLILNVSSDS